MPRTVNGQYVSITIHDHPPTDFSPDVEAYNPRGWNAAISKTKMLAEKYSSLKDCSGCMKKVEKSICVISRKGTVICDPCWVKLFICQDCQTPIDKQYWIINDGLMSDMGCQGCSLPAERNPLVLEGKSIKTSGIIASRKNRVWRIQS
jgi:hypothetical protein